MQSTCIPDNKCTILLIEDSIDQAELLQTLVIMYGKNGFHLCHKRNLEEGLFCLYDHNRESINSIDIILLDLHIPKTSNSSDYTTKLEAQDAILEITDKIPIIIITSSNDEELAEEAIIKGAQKYIIKEEAFLSPKMFCQELRESILRQRHRTTISDYCEKLEHKLKEYEIKKNQIENNDAVQNVRDVKEMLTNLLRNINIRMI
jgi:response regulator RpfG family c-di-GMP phosphodiesterase